MIIGVQVDDGSAAFAEVLWCSILPSHVRIIWRDREVGDTRGEGR